MPKIPVLPENRQMNPNSPVPIRSPEAFGREGEAIQQAGRGLMQFGSALNDVVMRQQEADAILREKEAKDKISAIMTRNAATVRQSGGDDYVGAFNKLTPDEVKSVIAEEKDPAVRKRVTSWAAGAHSATTANLFGEQLKANEIKMTYKVRDLGNAAADRVRENPALAEQEFTIFENEVLAPMQKKGILDVQTHAKISDATKNTIAVQMIEGLINRKQYGQAANLLKATGDTNVDFSVDLSPADAKDMGLIDQKKFNDLMQKGENFRQPMVDAKGQTLSPAMTKILSAITPQQKDSLLSKIQNQLKTREGMRAADLNAKINNITEAALDGVEIPKEKIQEVLANIDSMSTLPDVAKKTLADTVLSAVQVGRAAQEIARTPPSEWPEILQRVDRRNAGGDKLFNYAKRTQHIQQLKQATLNILKEREKDPAGYALKYNPDVQQAARAAADGHPDGVAPYVSSVLSAQKRLGVPEYKQKLLTSSQALGIGQNLEAASSPQETVALVNGLKETYGKDFGRVLSEAAGKSESMQDLAILGYTNDPASDLRIASNIKDRKAIQKEWSDKFPESANRFNTAVSLALDKYRGPLSSSFADGAGQLGNAFFEQVKVEAQRRMNADGVSMAGYVKHIEGAVEEIVGKNFSVASGGVSQVLVPNRVAGKPVDARQVSGFMKHYSEPENLKKLGVYEPQNQDANIWYKELAAKARWVMNPRMDGMVLTYQKDGRSLVVIDKNKKPIERSLDEIQKENLGGGFFNWGF